MDYSVKLNAIRDNVRQAIVGKDDVIDDLLVSLLCAGHVLIEDMPGLGKTTLVSALAASLGCSFRRIQFTPDVLPSDITGYTMYNMKTGEQEVHMGSIMHQIVLADEINRSSPKTQSALLEVMQEAQVTIDGQTYPAPSPFMVLATQNPIETAGTYPLPEAQLDRFLMRLSLGYPTREEEIQILATHRSRSRTKDLQAVVTAEDVIEMQRVLDTVTISPEIAEYIVAIAEATRNQPNVRLGVSPRGTIALMQASRGRAMLAGRSFVMPDDVQACARQVLCHRMVMKVQGGADRQTSAAVVESILQSLPVPGVGA